MSSDHKAEIQAAAESLGQSVTTFLTDAALRRARRVKKRPPSRGVHGGVPSFFKACCGEAAKGGKRGYFTAGWQLASSVGSESPYDIELEGWVEEVKHLQEFLAEGDDDGAWEWFQEHYPKFMALVPARRKAQFLDGVREAYEDGRLEV
jgi:hypothetical protein